jgi:hypothetical protein
VLSGAPAEVDAVTVEPVRALRWEVATLRRYLEADPQTRIVFQRNLSRDLAGKCGAWARSISDSRRRRVGNHDPHPTSARVIVFSETRACQCLFTRWAAKPWNRASDET